MKTKPKPKKPKLPPDADGKGMNEQRSDWVLVVLDKFKNLTGNDSDLSTVSDFLADLGHYCDRHELSLGELLQNAKMHYGAETQDEGTQFNFL